MAKTLGVGAVLAFVAGLSLAGFGPAGQAMAADTYALESKHTSVVFHYPHFGLSRPSGKIMGVSGALILDWDNPAQSTVTATLDMATLTTALPAFDDLLKGEAYFDVARYPTASFTSTAVEIVPEPADTAAAPRLAKVSGDLTIHGITQPVVLDVTFNKKAFNPALFKTGVGFSATAHISRKAFGLGNLEPIVGDDIDLEIEAEAY